VQQRAGQGGRAFELYKFRTMKNAFDIHGNPLPDECRVHAWGNFLRKWSLDELPQLWNVLRGDMSLVGPRPLLVRYVERYSDYQRRRLEALPGLTGWAQINGRNALSWNEKFELDVWYVDRASLKLDLLILWRTFSSVFRPRGIRAAQHATMPEFLGNSSTENATPQLSNSFSTEKQSAI
jgi:lipopolysaccharide/colanic/teichoic acid biosynthesis glycosyltransferase